MANSVATVASLEGQAWAKSPDGKLRPLKVGDTVTAEEVVVTASGAHIELDFGDGHPVSIAGGQEVLMNRDLWTDLASDNKDAAVDNASVQEALTVLNNGGDLTTTLEETAAGLSGGAANEGHNFVELARVVEQTDPNAFNFSTTTSDTGGTPNTQGSAPVNNAPLVDAQSFSGDEDTLISGRVIANDVENDSLTYAIAGQPANGTLTLDPATGDFKYTPNTNYNGTDSFVVTVTDDHGNTTTSTVTLTVNPVNDAPVTNDQNLTTAEDTPVSGQVVATDVEGDTLTYSVSTTAAHGTVTLNATTGGFIYTPSADFNGSDSFVVTVSDGNGGTTTSTITIGVTPVNDAPVSNNQNLTTPEDTPLSGAVVATDVDGDTLAYSVTSAAAHGTVTLNPATGAFVYTPSANYNGSDSFVVTIADGQGGVTTSVINIGVTPVNDAPDTTNQNLTTPEDTAISGQVVASDVEGDTLSYSVTTTAAHGTVTIDPATGGFVYTPAANYNGPDQFVVSVSDGNGGVSTSIINIGVTPVNDAPVAADQNLSTPEDTAISGQVTATDADGDVLTYSVTSNAAHGSVTLDPATGDFVYTPNSNYNGSDSFIVTVDDGKGGLTTSVINIGVTPLNDAPTSGNQNLSTPQDTPINGAISANDPDGDPLSYSVSGTPVHGTLVLNSTTGNFTYTPSTGYNGSDSFVVTINDGHGGTTTSTVNVGVQPLAPVNHAPTANTDSATTDESTAVTVAVRANDTDPDGDALTVSGVTQGANGSVVVDAITGNPIYTPNAGFTGSDSFTYTINDGHGGTSTATVNVTVNAVAPGNHAPVTVAENLTVAEGGTATILTGGATSLLANDTDADNDPLTAVLVSGPANGTLTLNANGTFSYTHNGGETTTDSFTYRANDGTANGNIVTVNIAVTPVNDAPVNTVPAAQTLNENGTLVFNSGNGNLISVNDVDAGSSSVQVTLTATHGTIDLSGTTGLTFVVGSGSGDLTMTFTGTQADINNALNGLTYTPTAGYTGSAALQITTNDLGNTGSGGAKTDTDTVSLSINPFGNHVPVAVADTITVAEGGTATILVGGATSVLTNDTDADSDPLTAILVSGPTNGTLTLNANGTFSYTHNGSETTSDSFTYKVNDGSVDGNTVIVNIGVTPVNDAPVAVADNINVAEGGTATILVGGATSVLANDTDAEGSPLTAILVSGPTNGSLTLNANGTFSYTHNGSETTADSFTYKVNDGTLDGNTVTVNIGVTPVNDAPLAVADTITVAEGGTATLLVGGATTVLANDTDPENNALTAVLVSGPVNGTLTLNANGTFSYTHNGSETTTDSFTYKVNDGTVDGNTVTVNINVTPVNDAPVANNDTATTDEDTSVTIAVRGNDTDAENDSLTVSGVTQGANGSVVIDGVTGNPIYTPNAGFAGSDSFTYTINDGHGGTATATVNVTVNAVNHAPVTVADSLVVAEGGTATTLNGGATSVLANDTDADGNPLTAILVSGPTNGTLTLNANGTFSYTHNGSETTTDSFTYKVNDGTVDGNTVTVNIGVTPVNDAPIAVADSITVAEGGTATILVGGATSVLANDTDAENNSLNASLVTGPAHGTLTLNTDGTFSYTHDGSETTSDSFTYKVNDGTVDGNTVTVNIGVTPVNDAPVAVADSITVAEGGTATVLVGGATSLLGNDTDAENDTLNAILVTGPAHGTLTLNANGTFSYTHDGSETTSDSFTYKVNDGTVDGNIVTVNIGVTSLNDIPVSGDQNLTTPEDTQLIGAVVATDADGDPLAYSITTTAAHGSVVLNPTTGAFTYTPNANYNGSDSFVVTISDGNGGTTTSQINIGVTPVNDAPVAVADTISVAEGGTATVLVGGASSVLANDSDLDADALSAILVSGPAHGTLTLNANGTFSYTHDGSQTTTDSFTYKVNDGTVDGNTVTVNVGVIPVNNTPAAVSDSITVVEGGTATLLVGGATSVLANDTDADGDTLTAVLVSGPTNGTLTLNPNGTFSYTHNGSETTTDSFTYKVNDGSVEGNTVTVNIGVTPVNDAPVAVADSITVAEGGTATILVGGATSVLANDTDAENNPLTAVLVSGPAHGTLTLNADGTFSYTHDGSETTGDSFTYKVNDGTVDGNTVTVNIGVTPVNDAPIALNDIATTNESTPVAVAVRNNDTDIEGNGLTVSAVTQGGNGSVIIDPITGNPIYTPNTGFSGSDSFTYTVSDGNGGAATATVNVSVNAAPQTNALVVAGNEDTAMPVTLSGSDSDGSLAGFVIKSLPVNGTLYSDIALTNPIAVGDLVSSQVYFMPNANWNGVTNFNYAARDNLGQEDATPASVNITVNPVADAAVLSTGSGAVKEDTPAQSSASGTLTIADPDAGEASFTAQTNTAGTYGSFSINSAGAWVYNLDNSKPGVQALKEGETKIEHFMVTSIDGTTTTVNITVTGTNDVPVAIGDTASVNQNAVLTLTPAQLLTNDTDIDGDVLSITSVQGAVNGSVSLVNGNAVFTPTSGYSGPASFTYTVNDGQGGTATATVNVTVIKPNSPPDAVNDTAAPASSTSTGFYSEYYGYNEGPDGANLTSVQQIYSFINGRTPNATFTAKLFDYGASFTTGNDLGAGTNLQTFLGSDAASLSADPATTSDAIIRMRGFMNLGAGTYNFKVLADDGYQILVDGVVIAERNQNQSSTTTVHNQFTLAAGGLHYVEILYWDQGGYARLKVELSDNAGASYNLISTVPNYATSVFAAVEDTPLNISAASLLANDTDPDADVLTVTSVQGAVNGTVSLVNGNIVFTPTANYAGPASFTYTISDGKGGVDTATVNLSVAPVNDAPTAVANSATTGMNAALTIPVATLLANDSDTDGDVISIVSVQNPANGTVSLLGSNVIFTPANNFEGTASFTYTIRDTVGATGTAAVNVTVGSATTPSLVVSKSLLAVAHGTGGTSVKFPIMTALVDTDGSESLSIKVSGVPTGLSFNAGTDLGGGVWQFASTDLSNLTLNLPGSYTTLATNMTVQVTSTEINGGATASVSSVVTLKAAYTTVDVTTTDSGSYTGSSANEYIQGGNGNNTINASSGNNIVYGGGGDDNLSAAAGSDMFFGGSGNDTINAGSGTDRISGGSGNDNLTGGDAGEGFVDVFVWSLGDQGAAGTPAVDTIQNFATAAAGSSTNGGDVLDLRDLLQGESVGASNSAGNLANYLHFEVSGANTVVHISHTGGFSADSHSIGGSYTSGAETQQIVLSGVNLQTLYSGATTDQQIITQLLNNNKLITD